MNFKNYCQRSLPGLLKQYGLIKNRPPQNSVAKLAYRRKEETGSLIISCKRTEYNHYSNQKYNHLDEVVLASKGWNHSKSKGDYFIVNPNPTPPNDEKVSLNDVDINHNIRNCLFDQNIHQLTSFQNEVFNTILQGKHSLVAAETGCGKTLAYLLPIIHKLMGTKTNALNTPKALVIVPSRELAQQIGIITQVLTEAVGLKSQVIVGGRTKKMMLNPEFSDVDILIATPGAIGKLSTVGVYKLNNVEMAVFDEADTLIDDSFIERLTGIVKRLSQSQIILVSATLPTSLPAILEPYSDRLVKLTSPLLHKPLNHITQKFLKVGRSTKPQQLLQIVKNKSDQLLVFTNRNETCHWLSYFLKENGLVCSRVNGNMNYADRIEQWHNFKSERSRILVTTDICSRGLDMINVKHLINYDFPLYVADYLHRVGRTGRFGTRGFVTNFVAGEKEVKVVQRIELAIRKNEPLPNVDGNVTRIVQKKILRKMREDELM
ncbi:hypothetical protein RN001_003823 [Aquatica leii]|uniref:RNA helicase n=1 Tax=Aquatica leii TaxID=1421715 RepID=A0AAN7SL10_9COLE|nr:hypothetical protein RN001_003823 [Aquatica leii]